MRRINTLLKGASQRSQGGGVMPHTPPSSGSEQVVHIVDLFGFEAREVSYVVICYD